MNIVQASAQVITETHPLKKIELCGRVCYKSEERITPVSAYNFVAKLIINKHTSVLEHARVKLTDPVLLETLDKALEETGEREDYEAARELAAVMSRTDDLPEGFAMNVRDLARLFSDLSLAEIAKMENADNYLTVRFICDRGIANELVRHRVFSFSQESTRYVNYADGVTFVLPEPYIHPVTFKANYHLWKAACANAENAYKVLLESGVAPQEARNVLPLSTKTELIMTGTYAQWKQLIKLRTAAGAHPQMRLLMNRLLEAEGFPKELIPAPQGDFTI